MIEKVREIFTLKRFKIQMLQMTKLFSLQFCAGYLNSTIIKITCT